jgi:hypothetical protein
MAPCLFYRVLFILFGIALGWLLWQKNTRDFHASDAVSVRLEIFDLGRGIFGDAGQEISALRQVRRLTA